jgi:hypothetical protein
VAKLRCGSGFVTPKHPMAWGIHEFGGTSLDSPERIHHVAKRVAK